MGAGDVFAPIFLPATLSSNCCFQLSCADYGTFRYNHKTYGRFLGTIFFGGFGSPLVAERQRLATEKIQKSRKKAVVIGRLCAWTIFQREAAVSRLRTQGKQP